MRTITEIEKSNTYELFKSLSGSGFDVSIVSHFDYSYNKDRRFLALIVENSDRRLFELLEFTHEESFEAILTNVKPDEPAFLVRKKYDFAEFVEEKTWNDFYKSIKK